MDVYKLLHEDHLNVKSIFDELEDTTEKAVKTREHLFTTLKMELTIHTEAEEKFFYPRTKEAEETHELTLEAEEEHKVIKSLLDQLESEPKGTEEWAAKCKVLMENVDHHVKEEETELFPKAKKILSAEDAISIAQEIEAFKEEQTAFEER